MAIIPEDKYPGKVKPADPDYPYGSARNVSAPGDGTGTPWEKDLVNDTLGFHQALLTEAGITPTGDPDKVGGSQYLDAVKVSAGRVVGNTNLLSNANFQIAGTVATPPSATPTDYNSGDQVFAGFFAGDDGATLTYDSGALNVTEGSIYQDVSISGAIKYLDESQFTASLSNKSDVLSADGVSFSKVGDAYRVVIGVASDVFSVKFAQEKVASKHDVDRGVLDDFSFPSVGAIEFDNVESLKNQSRYDFNVLSSNFTSVKIKSYFDGWAATKRGAVSFDGHIITASQYGSTPDGYGDFYVGGGTNYVFKLRYNNRVKAEWFGCVGSFDETDAPKVKAAVEYGAPEVVFNGNYSFDAMTIPSGTKLRGTGDTSLKLVADYSVSSGAVIQCGSTVGVVIDGINFIGQGEVIGKPYNLISANESDKFKFINGDFTDVHGECIRLNKANRALIENADFSNITGEASDPGEGVYALGLINSRINNISGENIGDHILYLQGEDNFDFTELRNVRIENVYVKKTGQNGLTGGAAIVLYNRSTDCTIDKVTTIDCASGVQLSTKSNYTGQASLRCSISNVYNTGTINRGIRVFTDAADNKEHKELSLSNVKTIGCLGAWGHELSNVVGLNIDNTCKAAAGAGGGMTMTDCRKGTLVGGDYSDNANGYGIFTSNLEDFNLTGWFASRNFRAGLALSGNPVRVRASLGLNLPTDGVNDTFLISDTAADCVVFGMTPRNLGNVVGSSIWGSSIPTEGYWNKGDIIYNSGYDGSNTEAWRCTVSGAPGTWVAV